ncbi:E3 ubiquitin-protein ligase Topors-like [Ctenocephalides felis]|uniref:E3 ubiquitin-protein ligase Topors-like n=1 Tax=Ctenocephalides felis TaxID=7515 RepID=UPI000E6E5968|nr:E3 ubiquitin-protein ligase Topors-like [Ctenocephalides felis]
MQFKDTLGTRLQILDTYKEFLNTTQNKLTSFLDQIGWNEKDTFSEKINGGQPKKNVSKSNSKVLNEQKLYPDVWLPETAKSCIKLGMKDINKIINKDTYNQKSEKVPQSLEQYQSAFSNNERLMVYEYVLKNTELETNSDLNLNFSLANDSNTSANENSSFQDELALKRDLKRRRAKYRKPASRGYKQELKDTIETQMEMYMNYLEKKYGLVNPNSLNNVKEDAIKVIEKENTTSQYEYFTEEHIFEETLKKRKERENNEQSRSRIVDTLRGKKPSSSKFNESDFYFHAHSENLDKQKSSADKKESSTHDYRSRNTKKDSCYEVPKKYNEYKSSSSSSKRRYSSDYESDKSKEQNYKKRSDDRKEKYKRDKYDYYDTSEHKRHKKHKHKHKHSH